MTPPTAIHEELSAPAARGDLRDLLELPLDHLHGLPRRGARERADATLELLERRLQRAGLRPLDPRAGAGGDPERRHYFFSATLYCLL